MPGCGVLGRPSGSGKTARARRVPAGPSSDLPSVTRLAVSLADKAALSSLALGRPALDCLGGSLYIKTLCKPFTGFSVVGAPTGCNRPPPKKGAPPRPSACLRRDASRQAGRPPPDAVARVLVLGLRPFRPPLLRVKPRTTPALSRGRSRSLAGGLQGADRRGGHRSGLTQSKGSRGPSVGCAHLGPAEGERSRIQRAPEHRS